VADARSEGMTPIRYGTAAAGSLFLQPADQR
jgi:hypothetical protein